MDKYGRKALDIIEKLEREEPNERNFEMRAMAFINLAGDKIKDVMMGEMEGYDGMRQDEYARGRGRGRGRGYTRVSGYTRRRYDGSPMDEDEMMMDDWDEEERYYNGGGSSGGGRSGGMSGGGRSGGGSGMSGGRSGGSRYDGGRM